MAVDKRWSMLQAVEIAKEFGRGGTALNPNTVLKNAYDTLNEIQSETDKEQ